MPTATLAQIKTTELSKCVTDRTTCAMFWFNICFWSARVSSGYQAVNHQGTMKKSVDFTGCGFHSFCWCSFQLTRSLFFRNQSFLSLFPLISLFSPSLFIFAHGQSDCHTGKGSSIAPSPYFWWCLQRLPRLFRFSVPAVEIF